MRILFIGCVLFVAACAPRQEIVPPVYSLNRDSCQEEPKIASALPIGFNPEEVVSINLRIDQTSNCLSADNNENQLYQIIKLPAQSAPYIITVGSQPNGQSIFAPSIATLLDTGEVAREFDQSNFLFRAGKLTTKLKVEATEQYLMVASNPASVGESTTQITNLINRNSGYSNGIIYNFNTGAENRSSYQFSHAGMVTVTTQALPSRSLSSE